MSSNEAPPGIDAAQTKARTARPHRTLRIVAAWAQILYLLVGGLMWALETAFLPLRVGFVTANAAFDVSFLVWVAVAARCFRGPDEVIDQERPWWRLTSKPVASWAVASVLVFLALRVLVNLESVLAEPGSGEIRVTLEATYGATAVILVVVAGLFVQSAIRLGRLLRTTRSGA